MIILTGVEVAYTVAGQYAVKSLGIKEAKAFIPNLKNGFDFANVYYDVDGEIVKAKFTDFEALVEELGE